MGKKNHAAKHRSLEVEALRRHVDVDGLPFSYVVKWSRAARNCRLEFDVEEGLMAIVPLRLGDEALTDLLTTKRRWIRRRYDEFMARRKIVEERRLRDSGPFLYLGREFSLKVYPDNGARGAVTVGESTIFVGVPADDVAALRAALSRWLRAEARTVLTPWLEEYSRRMGVSYHRVFIRNQRTRWASCSGARNLNFNFHVAMAPVDVIRYLVVHELAHLKTMRHGKRFHQIVNKYYPEHAEAEKWLRQNEDLLIF